MRARTPVPTSREGVPTPALLVDLDRFEANVSAAARLFAGSGKVLRPHIKAHRTPGLALRQLGPGTAGITCATVGEAEAMAAVGIDDIFLANEVVSADKVARLVALSERATVTVAVDSPTGVTMLSREARRSGATVGVLVDVDVGIHRCGVADAASAVRLARLVAKSPGLRLVGVMGYEGRIRARDDDRAQRIQGAYAKLARVRAAFTRDGLPVGVVSSAGTATIHEALADPTITEIQAGTYALMEHDLDGLGLPFEPAVEILATVISRGRGRAILDVGKKSVACDYGLPVPLFEGATARSTHEEHTTLAWDGWPPRLGTKLALRPLHIRLTFNLHDSVWLVRGDTVLGSVPVAARGRSR